MIEFCISFFAGAIGVLQNTLNKKYAEAIGLPFALLVNCLVLLVLCGLLLLFVSLAQSNGLPALLRTPKSIPSFSMAYLLPGVFGFTIILAMPFVIQQIGATKVFITVIAAQIIVSMAWDYFADGTTIGVWRIVGGALTLVGALLAMRD